ncbi:MAG: hypothetical protein AAGD17_05225 [Bacteroidota bacterium]
MIYFYGKITSGVLPVRNWKIRKPNRKIILDLLAHYCIAFWVLLLFFFLLDIYRLMPSKGWLLCAGLALLILPLRLLGLHLLKSQERDKYIKQIFDDIMRND